MSNAKRLLAEALALPEDEREELAATLLDSLEAAPHGISIDDRNEIERRASEAKEGAVGVPWEEVRRAVLK